MKACEAVLWVQIYKWAEIETSNSSSTLSVVNGILKIEIFLWVSDNFFDSL